MRTNHLRVLVFALAAILLAGCGGCEDGLAGSACQPDDPGYCVEGLVCAPDGSGDHFCLIPNGGACDLDAEPSHCLSGSRCYAGEDGAGVCLVSRGNGCSMEEPFCGPGLVCAERTSGDPACFEPVVLSGYVFDTETRDAIEGAHLIALNEEATAISDVAISQPDGTYELVVPARRDADGKPAGQFYTLRASAQDYQTFPGGIRTALPIDASAAVSTDERWVIATALTEVALIPLEEGERGRLSISGTVRSDVRRDGVLVVAEQGGSGVSAVSDRHGRYTIFNVPSGAHTVRGYAAGVQLAPVDVALADAHLEEVDLHDSGQGLTTLTGQIQIVAAGGGQTTSVILIAASTFDEQTVRGEVPSGLRAPRSGAPSIDGDWTIADVPAGDYVVLAAFENDQLVRDPDPGIAGTEIVRITVPPAGGTMALGQSFKVTAAVAILSPGPERAEAVTEKPLLSWAPISNADEYSVTVFDAYGDIVWEADGIPKDGNADRSVQYAGPLDDGMYYQFRVTAWRRGEPTSMSEDLLGVFYKE